MRIPVVGRIRSEFQSLEGLSHNFNVLKDRAKIPTFGRIRPEFECLER